jgi:hypothetical protein
MAEGRKRAVKNGVKFGRPHKLDAFQKREALARLEAAGPFRVSRSVASLSHVC